MKFMTNMDFESLETIEFCEFEKVDIQVCTIVRAEPYPEARKPAIKV